MLRVEESTVYSFARGEKDSILGWICTRGELIITPSRDTMSWHKLIISGKSWWVDQEERYEKQWGDDHEKLGLLWMLYLREFRMLKTAGMTSNLESKNILSCFSEMNHVDRTPHFPHPFISSNIVPIVIPITLIVVHNST